MATSARPRRRADAERSIARIVSAAREVLSRDPDASIDDVVKAAGVGRMTLYGHFPNRASLVEAALAEALRVGEEVLSAVDLEGDARAALARLIEPSWSLVAESTKLLQAAEDVLPAARIRELHGDAATRMADLIRRGQRQGVFRTDLPLTWLVNVVHYVLNGAAEETRAGRLGAAEAPGVVIATVQSFLTPPAGGQAMSGN
ncbi:TetR/AcrR family transcriptional regulator [Amycolatopsis thermophila]|uniref:AcrR family transcriptional regulator n=1 Tax=Amycolatopsis thermophila TaxID=206084 RepID=A0ABU0EZ71_9PSEU|nr:TetR/AcrR family transcriptional regulator [Amycolatopsis thermophila]MDQ0380409.1 AcrR family transcriptional regulator [Amycolatopsis thermophila]